MGEGFLISTADAAGLSVLDGSSLRPPLRPYRNGRDITERSRDLLAIDLKDMSEAQARQDHPAFFEHLLATVKPHRDVNRRSAYRERWWLFGEGRRPFRSTLTGLTRYIVTSEIAKHRWFRFLDGEVLADNRLVCVASDDAAVLAVLSSRAHLIWAEAYGGTLEDRPIYSKSACFDRFPFPVLTPGQGQRLRLLGEELERHRDRIIAADPGLTMTTLYNLKATIESGARNPRPGKSDLGEIAMTRTLAHLHRQIDRLVLESYGWSSDMQDGAVLAHLRILNRERAAEEAQGVVRYLRPSVQRRPTGRRDVATVIPIRRGEMCDQAVAATPRDLTVARL